MSCRYTQTLGSRWCVVCVYECVRVCEYVCVRVCVGECAGVCELYECVYVKT